MISETCEFVNSAVNIFERKKSSIIYYIKILISSALIIFLFKYLDIKNLLSTFENANYILVAAAFFLAIVNIYFQFRKWKLSCNILLNEFSNSKILYSLFYGFAGGSFTPARVGEYLGRYFVFKNKSSLQVFAATFIDKFFTILFVAICGSVASIIFLYSFYNLSMYGTISLSILTGLLFFFAFRFLFKENGRENFILKKLNAMKYLSKYTENLKILFNVNRTFYVKMLIYTFAFYVTILVQFTLLIAAYSDHSEVIKYFWAVVLIMFSKTFIPPVSIGEIGVRESVSVFFLTKMGEMPETAFNASITIFILNILLPALIGLILTFKRKND